MILDLVLFMTKGPVIAFSLFCFALLSSKKEFANFSQKSHDQSNISNRLIGTAVLEVKVENPVILLVFHILDWEQSWQKWLEDRKAEYLWLIASD